jgi:HYR domain-containing protein
MIAAPVPGRIASLSQPTYTVASVPFSPETAPAAVPATFVLACDDCTHFKTEMGFDFTFYGRTYHQVNIVANGFVAFDTVDANEGGCCEGGSIPFGGDAPYNNLIAIAWTDLNAGAVGANVRAETQGIAPNRKFVVQFNNVPEYSRGPGRVTAQLVLYEGSNDIVINTWSQNILTNPYHFVTQGIENADGSEAAFLPGRVHAFFALSSDAVRFSLAHTNQPPVVVAPPNLAVTTASAVNSRLSSLSSGSVTGTCAAFVNPGVATATDDADGVTVTGTRNDGLKLDDAYPKGITTINWTATDAGGLTAFASQTVTVDDKENPSVIPPADISTRIDRSASTATVVVGTAVAADNCPDVKVAGARNDGADLSSPYPVGLTTIKWTATDASGNIGSADQQITVSGNKPPVIAAPMTLVFNTDPGVCAAVENVATPGVTDDTEGSTVEPRRSDGLSMSAAYPKGVTTITWTATDADGATSSASQSLTVNDGEAPSINKPSDISGGNDHGLASAVIAVGKPSATDNCREVSVDGLRSDGAALDAPFNVGVTTINWTARDAAGNKATATQAITVRDNEAPTITVPADMKVNASVPGGAYVSYTASWSDNVRVMNGSCAPASGSMFPIGPTKVNCSAIDAAGNQGFGSFTVTVLGPAGQMMSLMDFVVSQNLPNGMANPLLAQLRAAYRTDDVHVSCVKMRDFINTVVKDGIGEITDAAYSYMTSDAAEIMGAMGCSPGTANQQQVR